LNPTAGSAANERQALLSITSQKKKHKKGIKQSNATEKHSVEKTITAETFEALSHYQ
jgi:hypothetical protein